MRCLGAVPMISQPFTWFYGLISRPSFQHWANRTPVFRNLARREGAAIFDLVQGFAKSQALLALVALDVLEQLRSGAKSAVDLGEVTNIPTERMNVLLQAGAALGVLRRCRNNRYGLARHGAAILGVPGLQQLIQHHQIFYRDLADPVALFRNKQDTELSKFWPYVLGSDGTASSDVIETYSDLMAQSQKLVAHDTLDTVALAGAQCLLDIGGGTGVFLQEVAARYPDIRLMLFDLPQVIAAADQNLGVVGLRDRVQRHAGSFQDTDLPKGADVVTLIRVLYDHGDRTVAKLLKKVYAAMPAGGQLIVSEPMSGGPRPRLAGDIYFAFYTLAMQTGRTRSPAEIKRLCQAAGFTTVRSPRPKRDYVTQVVTARKPK